MNVGPQKIVDGGVHQAMPGHGRRMPRNASSHDGHAKMAVASGRSGMADVQMTFVLNNEAMA